VDDGTNILNLSLTRAAGTTLTSLGASTYETVNIAAGGSAGAANEITALTVNTNGKIVVTGAQALTSTVIGTNATLDASAATGKITFTGEAGNNSITTGSGNDVIDGAAGTDTIVAGAGNDTITGGADGDTLTGGTGSDTFVYTTLTDSLVATRDRITDFVAGTDKFDVTVVPTDLLQGTQYTAAGTGTLATDIAAALAAGGGTLSVTSAAVVTITGTGAGTYLVIGDATTAGYAAADDAVINITGLTGTLTLSDFI
jgi:Ca2+-binding RTX toxin-like protein